MSQFEEQVKESLSALMDDESSDLEARRILKELEIGDANQIIKEKFGEDVVIKKFEKSKGWLSKKLSSSNDHVDQLVNILDEKSVWQRYGL